ncbi:MAG: 3-dehydroquinate synthase [Clostridiales bacterium]|nr:3-dehydroquinate synthase [Clostridiales bacterium]
MDKLHVNLGADSYDICFTDSFDPLVSSLKEINAPKKLLIVTDTNVRDLYADEVNNILTAAGYDSAVYAFPAGEENKSMDSILGICGACIEHGLDRKSMILALGGGVVGDMAGFAAAIYMRGINFVQIPTTLLSQSDSSVGGKTGIDFMESKNILGAFHQPKLVYINVSVLKTLPHIQFVSGMGEVIKHGIIRDADFYAFIKENKELIKALDSTTLIKTVKRNCEIKAEVVEQDEKENALRAILNFGHTIGHAAESALNFTTTHGECVGIGMAAVSHIAVNRGLISEAVLEDIEATLSGYDFRVRMELPPSEAIYEFMQKDKKKSDGKLTFVLPIRIGDVIQTRDVTEEEIFDAIRYISK